MTHSAARFGVGRRRGGVLVIAALSGFGCGSSSSADPPQDTGDAGTYSAKCRGFQLEGLRYSPGGSVLPNTCEPFDPLTNNPYAVRCVDAMPGYKTRYPGDDHCILPPPPEQGLQIGVHPRLVLADRDGRRTVKSGSLQNPRSLACRVSLT